MTVILTISGKRTCGKDKTLEIMRTILSSNNINFDIVRTSTIVKKKYCDENNINIDEFESNYALKDSHRDKLTSFFYDFVDGADGINKIIEYIKSYILEKDPKILIIPDLRLKKVLDFLTLNFKTINIRINASDESRKLRGWIKTSYDDLDIETQLDDYEFNEVINNDNTEQFLFDTTKHILSKYLVINK